RTHDQITQKPARSGNTADHAEKPLLTLLKNTAHNAERKLLKHSVADPLRHGGRIGADVCLVRLHVPGAHLA
ncbi:hypothetical protein, partial [Bifidobacterium pseudolongum]|uniref:hypothetical protein n=1 Tax=Bifidobacterium pseudolongum TaxID=1694 RepID=UPI0010E33331